MSIHLTHTGFYAGRRFCESNDNGRNVHGSYAPLQNDDFRAQCCNDCLKVWADSYDDGEIFPLWVSAIRNEV